jgi:hypothetical protein
MCVVATSRLWHGHWIRLLSGLDVVDGCGSGRANQTASYTTVPLCMATGQVHGQVVCHGRRIVRRFRVYDRKGVLTNERINHTRAHAPDADTDRGGGVGSRYQ